MHEYRAKTNLKIQKFQSVLNGEIDDQNKWDSDDDMADHEFFLGEKLD